MIIWLVGLSGAGKTTIGREVYSYLKQQHPNTVFLDGDEVRKVFNNDKGAYNYTIEGRRENAERIIALCEMLDLQGINVVCSILCIFPDLLAQNRNLYDKYLEVYVDAPIKTLQERDVKGLYAAAAAGKEKNIVGIDIEFPEPEKPDLILNSSNPGDLQTNIESAIKYIAQHG